MFKCYQICSQVAKLANFCNFDQYSGFDFAWVSHLFFLSLIVSNCNLRHKYIPGLLLCWYYCWLHISFIYFYYFDITNFINFVKTTYPVLLYCYLLTKKKLYSFKLHPIETYKQCLCLEFRGPTLRPAIGRIVAAFAAIVICFWMKLKLGFKFVVLREKCDLRAFLTKLWFSFSCK